MGSHARRFLGAKYVRLALAMAYAAAMIWIVPRGPMQAPVLFIALGVPLIFRLVPRNWLYGLRTRRTMWTTEETWYRQNVITGAAMVLIGVVWMLVVALR